MKTAQLLEILFRYNRFWDNKPIEKGIERNLLQQCLKQVDSKETVVLKGVRRCGKSTLMVQGFLP